MRHPKLNRKQRDRIRLLPDDAIKISRVANWQRPYHIKSTPRPKRRDFYLKGKR